jgi:hypothetical protein
MHVILAHGPAWACMASARRRMRFHVRAGQINRAGRVRAGSTQSCCWQLMLLRPRISGRCSFFFVRGRISCVVLLDTRSVFGRSLCFHPLPGNEEEGGLQGRRHLGHSTPHVRVFIPCLLRCAVPHLPHFFFMPSPSAVAAGEDTFLYQACVEEFKKCCCSCFESTEAWPSRHCWYTACWCSHMWASLSSPHSPPSQPRPPLFPLPLGCRLLLLSCRQTNSSAPGLHATRRSHNQLPRNKRRPARACTHTHSCSYTCT